MKVIDSFAWIEYFSGSKAGQRLEKLLQESENLLTPATCITEIKRRFRREKQPWNAHILFIKARSKIVPVTLEIAEKAGEIDQLHFADALVYATSQVLKAPVVTGDPHFKGLPDVEMI